MNIYKKQNETKQTYPLSVFLFIPSKETANNGKLNVDRAYRVLYSCSVDNVIERKQLLIARLTGAKIFAACRQTWWAIVRIAQQSKTTTL